MTVRLPNTQPGSSGVVFFTYNAPPPHDLCGKFEIYVDVMDAPEDE